MTTRTSEAATSSLLETLQAIEGEMRKVPRYDLITNYRCGSAIEEMERSDDGDWVRYDDVLAALARLTAERQEPAPLVPPQQEQQENQPEPTCEHGVAWDVHCCGCHSGFLFDSRKCVCF